MRSKFAILLAIAAVCVTTAWADWTSESLVTGGSGVTRQLLIANQRKLVYGTDGVGHLVWEGGPLSLNPYPYNFGIWYNRYNPGSGGRPGSWTADFAIAPAPKKSQGLRGVPCVALDGDGRTIHVVWEWSPWLKPGSCSLSYRRCTQDRRGNYKWDPIQLLYVAQSGIIPVVACVPSEPNHVLVCWRENVTGGSSAVIRFREYVKGAWTDVVRLDSALGLRYPSIAVASNGDVFVAYLGRDEGTSVRQIFVKTRTNGVWGERVDVAPGFTGLRWSTVAEVNPITTNPHIVFDRSWVVPYGAGEDTFDAVYHTYRNASGAWLTTPEVISEPRRYPTGGFDATMAFDGNGAAHVVWNDHVTTASRGIMYSYCSSEGGTWSTPECLTLYETYLTAFIAAEEPAHAIHVVWGRDYNFNCDEIWCKSNYLGGGGGGMAQPIALSQSGIELSPNPVKAGRVTVHYALPQAGPMTVTLLDVSGRAVRTQEVAASGVRGSVTIDVRGLSSGVYVARLVAGDLGVSKSLVVER